MYEVEVKARLSIGTALAQRKLEAAGLRFGIRQSQHDSIFARQKEEIINPFPGAIVARIRVEQERFAILTLKRQLDNELLCIEHETTVGNPGEAAAILTTLGLREVVRVHKQRVSAARGPMTIFIDEVDGLGSFVELELLQTDPATEEVQHRLERELHNLLPGFAERIHVGYDRLLLLNDQGPIG